MNICIAYFSKFGNGRKCVDELSGLLEGKGHSVATINVQETGPKDAPRADLYVFSSPTRAGQPVGKVLGFIKKGVYPEKAGFSIMVTGMDLSTGALNKLSGAAEKKGLRKACSGIKLKLDGLKGPLSEGYSDRLTAFSEELSSYIL